MERQRSFAQEEFLAEKKVTRRQVFLQEMEAVVPWARLTNSRPMGSLTLPSGGDGFDFKLEPKIQGAFLVVEVKGLREDTGTISLTSKEYRVAETLRDRYFVFVARNFADFPRYSLFRDPFESLSLIRRETKMVRIDWSAALPP